MLPVPTARPADACPELPARPSYRSHAHVTRSPLLASHPGSCCPCHMSTSPHSHHQVPWFSGTLDSNSGLELDSNSGCLSAGVSVSYSFRRGNSPLLVIHGALLSQACTAPLRKWVDLDPVTWFPGHRQGPQLPSCAPRRRQSIPPPCRPSRLANLKSPLSQRHCSLPL